VTAPAACAHVGDFFWGRLGTPIAVVKRQPPDAVLGADVERVAAPRDAGYRSIVDACKHARRSGITFGIVDRVDRVRQRSHDQFTGRRNEHFAWLVNVCNDAHVETVRDLGLRV